MSRYAKKYTFSEHHGFVGTKYKIRMWHDDVRPPPDESWDVWVTNNRAAMVLLATDLVEECSLDHDLGAVRVGYNAQDVMFLAGDSKEGSGLDLVKWMVAANHVPTEVTIHSWNPVGAQAMAHAFKDGGFFQNGSRLHIEPFVLK